MRPESPGGVFHPLRPLSRVSELLGLRGCEFATLPFPGDVDTAGLGTPVLGRLVFNNDGERCGGCPLRKPSKLFPSFFGIWGIVPGYFS